MDGVNTKLLLEYFNIKLIEGKTNIKIKLILKNEKKLKDAVPIFKDKNNRYPISGAESKYYINYLGDKIGDEVWQSRRKLLSKHKLTTWYLSCFETSDEIKNNLLAELDTIGNKLSKTAKQYFKSDDWTKYKVNNAEKIKYNNKRAAEISKERWLNDPEWVKRVMSKRYENKMYEKISKDRKFKFENDIKFREKMMKAFKDGKRRAKIGVASKQMWADARKNDKKKYYKMINNAKHKKFEINGIKMNSIEYKIGIALTELDINWEYEKIFENANSGYLPDFTLENNKVIIEAYGDFWHANPSMFVGTDTTHKKRTVAEVWEYDKKKKMFFENLGYKFIFFWENDIRENIEMIKEVISNETK